MCLLLGRRRRLFIARATRAVAAIPAISEAVTAIAAIAETVAAIPEATAAALDVTVATANSLLQRARAALPAMPHTRATPSPELLARYLRAWEDGDPDALIAILRSDAIATIGTIATTPARHANSQNPRPISAS